LDKIGKKGEFYNGMRITDEETMSVVHDVLRSISKEIVNLIQSIGGKANSPSQEEALGFIRAKKLIIGNKNKHEKKIDLGHVGEIESIKPLFMKNLIDHGMIPVIAPIGFGEDNKMYNINADLVAGKIAEVINAEKLVLMTNTKGVLNKDNNLITGLIPKEIESLIKTKVLSGGMLPKIQAALIAAENKVNSVHIIDGRVEHALLLEILTDQGVGTLIKAN